MRPIPGSRRTLGFLLLSAFIACAAQARGLKEFQSPLEVRGAFDTQDQCPDCTAFEYEDKGGMSRTVFLRGQRELAMNAKDFVFVQAWSTGDVHSISLIAKPLSRKLLADLAERATAQNADGIVFMNQRVLAVYSPSLLKVSHGALSFDFASAEHLSAALQVFSVGRDEVYTLSEEEWMTACIGLEGEGPEALARCRELTWSEIGRNRKSLQRAEELLNSRDTNAALEELLAE